MTRKQLIDLAVYQTKKTFGFAPAHCQVVLLESSENHGYCTALSWAVAGKGYSWCVGESVLRNPVYDLSV